MKQSLTQYFLAEQAAKASRSRMQKLAGILTESAEVVTESQTLAVSRFNGALPVRGLLLWMSSDRDQLVYVPGIRTMLTFENGIKHYTTPEEREAMETYDTYHEMSELTQEELVEFVQDAGPDAQVTVMTVAEVANMIKGWTQQAMAEDDGDDDDIY